jgi:hypothetical protein
MSQRFSVSSRILFSLLAALTLSGCGLIYTNIKVPRTYRSATAGEVKTQKTDRIVSGEACNYSALFLVAWGNGGYAAATQKALEGEPDSLLYDVKADVRAFSILGLYTKVCTIVTGKIAKP